MKLRSGFMWISFYAFVKADLTIIKAQLAPASAAYEYGVFLFLWYALAVLAIVCAFITRNWPK